MASVLVDARMAVPALVLVSIEWITLLASQVDTCIHTYPLA